MVASCCWVRDTALLSYDSRSLSAYKVRCDKVRRFRSCQEVWFSALGGGAFMNAANHWQAFTWRRANPACACVPCLSSALHHAKQISPAASLTSGFRSHPISVPPPTAAPQGYDRNSLYGAPPGDARSGVTMVENDREGDSTTSSINQSMAMIRGLVNDLDRRFDRGRSRLDGKHRHWKADVDIGNEKELVRFKGGIGNYTSKKHV
ncbi:hypothetical protein L1887_58043 [Cichorium endivia]|nr:hypothetical protein L1887_58043 [Cichorium endivia]